LRYSLDHAGKNLVTLAQELAIVRRYLEIQGQRFSDRLAVDVDVPSDVQQVRVPALMLQPLVENAIQHGVERVNGPATIKLRARRDGDSLVLAIENTSSGARPVGEGIGIANTRARLQQVFADRHSFSLVSEHDRVIATLCVPFEEAAA
jgi:LytS/YehU family sensor histidine kinase